jgi:hypothetical protein
MGAIGLQRRVQNLLIGAGAKTFGKVLLWTCERVVGQFDCGGPPRSRSSASVTLANSRHCKARHLISVASFIMGQPKP